MSTLVVEHPPLRAETEQACAAALGPEARRVEVPEGEPDEAGGEPDDLLGRGVREVEPLEAEGGLGDVVMDMDGQEISPSRW